jgi:membrane protease YdiL (CAAX protease family)
MNVTDVSPVQIDRPGYVDVVEWLFVLFALICFVRVAIYAIRQGRNGTLIDSRKSPLPFPVPPVPGWLFALSVVLLLFAQSPFYMLLVVAGIWAFLAAERQTAEYQFGFSRVSAINILRWSLVLCGAVFFVEIPFSHMVDRAMTAIQLPHPEQQSVEIFRHYNKASEIFLFMLQAVLISPLIEELFFRGFLFSFLKRFTATWFALVLSAGVFAFAHANLGSVLQLWLLGIVLGLAYENTGSLLLPIGVHGCFNFVTALSLLVEKGNS